LITLKQRPLENNIDIREELIKFHSQFYSSNVMKLVVLGKEPMADLVEMVRSKFSTVKNKHRGPVNYGVPFKHETLPVLFLFYIDPADPRYIASPTCPANQGLEDPQGHLSDPRRAL